MAKKSVIPAAAAGSSAQRARDQQVVSKPAKKGVVLNKDPTLTLHVYQSGATNKAPCTRTVWDKFRAAFWCLGLKDRAAGQHVPKILGWDYKVDHGIMYIGDRDDLERCIPMVSRVKVVVEEVTYSMRAWEEAELPSMVQLTVQLPGKEKLPADMEPMEAATMLMGFAVEDNNWQNLVEDGSCKVVVHQCFWAAHTVNNVRSDKGYWLIRFRVPLPVALFIRDKQNGQIQINTETFVVHHKSLEWRKGVEPTLIHESEAT